MNTRTLSRAALPNRRLAPATLLSDFDRLFGSAWPGAATRSLGTSVLPRIDVNESKDAWLVDAELPGLERSDIDVSVDEGVLTISGEHKREETQEEETSGYCHLERHRGSIRRSLRLPEEVEAQDIKAAYKNGVLSLTIPKPSKVEPEVLRIPVDVE